ncbi:coenzyme F420-0:L-glutamate ligase [Nitrosopumilus sp. b1]|uniref:coenzyme F420-0:L-glutamate ligase n=1 Tax=Nitrosopumilus sp. b1 TaxID=2109907 RepID=UPI0015F5FB67|nr:coenzyme F420-0:L-glutamate ligase [Nitrosopumilus sp. b1]KAF6242963.1 coenzyme F420-0:L-glutamate ligase [Nitrosopumilus sp. b1]
MQVIPIKIKHEIEENENLVNLIKNFKPAIEDGDILIVSQKIISKMEGRLIHLNSVIPSILAVGIASSYGKDPKLVQIILSESKRIIRMENGILIVETNLGYVCANAGVDESNIEKGFAALLPKNPDESARKLRDDVLSATGKNIGIIISDTFGRPFRMGQTDCAIGISGLDPIIDYEGKQDSFGKTLRVTAIAIADELCSAAELVRGKTQNCPFAIIRDFKYEQTNGNSSGLIRKENEDLFR